MTPNQQGRHEGLGRRHWTAWQSNGNPVWVVERTHAWINRNRRMVRQWDATLEAHTGFLILSQIAVLLNRLT